MEVDEPNAAALAALEAKRLASQRKRDATRAELDAKAGYQRRLRAKKAADAAAPPPPPPVRRIIRTVELACGIGGALLAAAALASAASAFANADFRTAFACDLDSGKLKLYNAAAAVQKPPSLPAVLADVTDAAFFTAARVASWGPADVLISSIPCTSVSRLGKRDGLKNKTVAAFIVGLLAIVGLVAAPVCVFECTVGLEADPRFFKALIKPLKAMGYSATWDSIDARHWVGAARLRLFIVCFRSAAAFETFAFPPQPPGREVKLYDCILPAYSAASAEVGALMAPLECYAVAKAQKGKLAEAAQAAKRTGRSAPTAHQRAKALVVRDSDLSIAARAVAKLPFVRGHKFSHVVTFHFNRVTFIEKTYGVAPTLTKAGAYMLRDAHGVRTLTGREVAKLHGYPEPVVEAYAAVASSNQIVAGVGDGFVFPVVRDLLKAALRAAEA